MKINLVTAKYNPKHNAVEEIRTGTTNSIKEAVKWLNKQIKPAMFYIDGLQNTDHWFTFGYVNNTQYFSEYKKVID